MAWIFTLFLLGIGLFFLATIIFFVGFYYIGKFFILIINKLTHKFFKKQLSTSYAYLLPCLAFLFCLMLAGGKGSLKYVDPQFYEFKMLCKTYGGKTIIGDKAPENFVYDDHLMRKQLASRIVETAFELKNNNETIFFKNNTYFYYNYGMFLKGDEGAGWHIDFDYEVLDCEYVDKKLRALL